MPGAAHPRSSPARRSARALVGAATIGWLLVAVACEADPNASTTAGPTSSVASTTSVATPPTDDATTTVVTGPGVDPTETTPTTTTSRPDATDVVRGSTTISHPTGSKAGTGTVRSVDFADLTYPTSVCADVIDHPPSGGFQLTDGWARSDESDADSPYTVQLRPARSFGDVDGDGREDVALVLECGRGSQPVPMGWIYTSDATGPRPLTGVDLDPDSLPVSGVLDTSLSSLRIADRTVVTDWDVYLDGDALCCPSKSAVVVWTWVDGQLTPGEPLLTRASTGH